MAGDPNGNPLEDAAHEERERAARADMQEAVGEIAKFLTTVLPKGTGFVMCLFDFGVGGSFAYASNGHREDVVKMLQEAVEKIRGGA